MPQDLLASLRELPGLYRAPTTSPAADGRPSLLLLFGGPRGMGKTSAALALAAELDLPTFEANIGELLAQDPVEATRSVGRLLDHARHSGGVLVLDGADALVRPARRDGGGSGRQPALTALLELDREGHRLPGIVIFCSELIHPGSQAEPVHFDRTLLFPESSPGVRERIWRRHLPQGHLIASSDIAYLAEAFRLSGKAIANCCATAEQAAAGGPVRLGHIAQRLNAEYAGRLTSDWTRSALAEVRARAERTSDETAPTGVEETIAPSTPGRGAPVPRTNRESAQSGRPLGPAARAPSQRMWRTVLTIAVAGAIAAVALGLALSHHSKARPAALTTRAPSKAQATLTSYRTALAHAIGMLNQARARFGAALASATTPGAEAQAAAGLAGAHTEAASTLARLNAGPADSANQALVGALHSAGGAYSALAQAAQRRDPRAYARAQRAISSAETSVTAAVSQVRAIVR